MSPLPFLELVLELFACPKDVQRSDWVGRRVPAPESVSDHMYRMAIMCRMVPGVQWESFFHLIPLLTISSLMIKHGRRPNAWHWSTIWERQWSEISRLMTERVGASIIYISKRSNSNNIIEEKQVREEIALKFLTYTIRSFNPAFADLILDY
jgi:hypothetical protein